MMLNYRRGEVGKLPWTIGWDRYCFLNSTQQRELLKVLPGAETTVLPPCTDLAPFLAVQPDFTGHVRVVRHNSQGDTKFPKDGGVAIQAALTRPDLTISMLPGPSFVLASERFTKVSRTADAAAIAQFLSTGNVFWYSLPEGYMDMGPRVILEAMAAGLPVIADPWGGALDRVTPQTGWLLDKAGQVEVLKTVTVEELRAKGQAARERARTEFVSERWVDLLVPAS
jgi:glycosyltransferase involved in cell wall biosynthesis